MGKRVRHIIIAALALTLVAFFFYKERDGAFAKEPHAPRALSAKWVIDGDTIELTSGERIRYVGIDTPEREEPFYEEARAVNADLLSGGELHFEPCALERRDRYGRLLGWVSVGNIDVGERLLSLGLAKTLTIPPCGLVRAKAYKEAEATAQRLGFGLWSVKK